MRENPWVWRLRIAMTAALAMASAVCAAASRWDSVFHGLRMALTAALSFAIVAYFLAMLLLLRGASATVERVLPEYEEVHLDALATAPQRGHARLDGEPPRGGRPSRT